MRVKLWFTILSLSLLGAVTGCGSSGGANPGNNDSAPQQWVTSNPSQKMVDIKLVANYNATNGGMNFDGYSNGGMTITVPQGWTLKFTFSNGTSMNVHSAMVVPYDDRTGSSFSSSSLAFKGASTPNPDVGTPNGQTQTFTFNADKSGKYAIVCAIPGHAALGMWDTLIVSSSASGASVST